MKASILLIFAFLISGHANQARATIVPSQKLPAEHFRLEFTDLNHDTRWYPGILLYVRTDRYVKVFDIPDWGQAKHLIFSKRIPRAAKSTIDFLNLKLDSLDNAYSNPCILPTCGEEFKVTFRRSKYQAGWTYRKAFQ
jgi:hypothetical protein